MDFFNYKLVVINNFSKSIYCKLSSDTSTEISDFNYISDVPYMRIFPRDSIHPHFGRNGEDWSRKINTESIDSTLHIYVFIVDTVKKYGWKKILSERMYDRKDFKAKQLDSINWTLNYYGVKP